MVHRIVSFWLAPASSLAHRLASLAMVGLLAAGGAGCNTPGSGEEAAAMAPTAPTRPAPDLAAAGTLRGRVSTTASEEPGRIRMDADAVCASLHPGDVVSQRLVRGPDGGLADAFVHVARGLEAYGFAAPAAAARLEQDGCLYRPRVLGLRAGQTLVIANLDPTLHNVHAAAKANRAFNEGQPRRGMESRRRFPNPEVMVPFKCDVHPWMTAFVGVVDHPYFAVTGADGAFALGPLPPGTYTVSVWHETLGTLERELTLEPHGTVDLAFTLPAAAPAGGRAPLTGHADE